MKKFCIYMLIAVAGLMATQTADAKIWRVNNNAGKSCDFADLTKALQELNKANGKIKRGDTIHIEGSVTTYGKTGAANNCDTIYKRVVIIGPGYLLSKNSQTQHNKESAKVRTLHIAKEAGGTIIAGIEQEKPGSGLSNYALLTPYKPVNSILTYYDLNTSWGATATSYKFRIEADSVTVTHCKLYYVDLYNANRDLTHITITKCMFNPGMIAASAGNKQVKNLIISNNFFRNDWTTVSNPTWAIPAVHAFTTIDLRYWTTQSTNNSPYSHATSISLFITSNNLYTYTAVNPIIQNNTFYHAFSIAAKGTNLYNNIFFPKVNNAYYYGLPQDASNPHVMRNNIIYNATLWTATASVGTGSYDTSYGGMLNDNVNYYNNTAESAWFKSTANLDQDNTFQLGDASPGRDATDVNNVTKQRGMFGGLSPYVLSGLYTIPAVWEITIPSYPSGEVPSTGFEVRVQVKSH